MTWASLVFTKDRLGTSFCSSSESSVIHGWSTHCPLFCFIEVIHSWSSLFSYIKIQNSVYRGSGSQVIASIAREFVRFAAPSLQKHTMARQVSTVGLLIPLFVCTDAQKFFIRDRYCSKRWLFYPDGLSKRIDQCSGFVAVSCSHRICSFRASLSAWKCPAPVL